jgi:SAM-dependent methyltransferase
MDCNVLPGLRVYQDLVLGGRTAVRGRRDCLGRWEVLLPHLSGCGTVLDVGSNLGWFGLKICEAFPDCVVASVEPDQRSATLQREVLQSHRSERICLLTSRADRRLAGRFVEAGQEFDAVLCLSVLHWLPDHQEFLSALGKIARRLLIEQPDPRESGAGFARIRQQIGPIGPYLKALFPTRPTRCLAQLPSHRQCPFPREIWLVGELPGPPRAASLGLDVSALLALSPSWPPRSWWQNRLTDSLDGLSRRGREPCRVFFTPQGLLVQEGIAGQPTLGQLRRRLARLPENRLLSPGEWLYRRARRLAGITLRRLGLRRRQNGR